MGNGGSRSAAGVARKPPNGAALTRMNAAAKAGAKLSEPQQRAVASIKEWMANRRGKPDSALDLRAARAIIAHVSSRQATQAPPPLPAKESESARQMMRRGEEEYQRLWLYANRANELMGNRALHEVADRMRGATELQDHAKRIMDIAERERNRTPEERAQLRQQVREYEAGKKSQDEARTRLEPLRTKLLESKSIMGAAHAWHDAFVNAPDRGTRAALRYMLSDYVDHIYSHVSVKYDGNAARKLNAFDKAWYQMAAAYGGDSRFKQPVMTIATVFEAAAATGKPDSELPISASTRSRARKSA